MSELEQLTAGIAAIEAQRATLGDAVVELALAPMRAKLASLSAARVGTADAGERALKQVTLLFLDVVGSTAFGRTLDPEDIQTIFDGTLRRCTTIVEAKQGRVLQYAGDSLLAVFGADGAQEDDAERAVHCGLALLAEAQRRPVESRIGGGFDVRVGIHTGSVLLGGGVDGEHSIRGSAVNVAARMEQSAPPGGLRISHDTYRHVRGVFDVQPQPPLEIKGIDEPIVTYLVQRAKARAFRVATRGIEGVETRMIGRDAELEQLQNAFRRVYRERRLVGVIVVGEAGLGKSRLLYEFENWAEARPETFYLFRGRAHPQTLSRPYGLLRDVLAWRLQIADDDSMALARQKLERGLVPLYEPDDGPEMAQAHAHLLGHLIGLDYADSRHVQGLQSDARQIRNRGFHAAAQMLRRVAAQDEAPVVLLLDDLHYADDGSLDFLNYLCQVDRDVPMLVLGLTRPGLFERRADLADTLGRPLRIDLAPLDRGVSRLLVNELLKKLDEVPSTLRELISGGADGNPFYMEELVKMLVDEGAIDASQERWSVRPDKLIATHVPQTLTGVLQARLDGLKPAERLALQQASVIGSVFWDRALGAIDPEACAALPALIRRELVIPHPDVQLDGMREYAFQHQILQQVTYGTVLKPMRRLCHARIAAWLADQRGARANDLLGPAAEHYREAGDADRACEYFTRAAEQARDRYAHEAAMLYVARAFEIGDMPGDVDRPAADRTSDRAALALRWRLLDVRERTFDLQGRRSEQHADIAALQSLADALDDDRRRSEVAWRRSDIAMRTGEARSMESGARQALALAERAGDPVLRLRAQQHLASALALLGQLGQARPLADEGLGVARSLGLHAIESLFINTLCFIANHEGDLTGSLELCRQALQIDRALGDARGEAISRLNLGNVLLEIGAVAPARRDLEEGQRLSRAVGDRLLEANTLNCLSQLALYVGDDTLALAHAQSALEIAVAADDPRTTIAALCRLGDAELTLGRHMEARSAFQRAQAMALALDNPTPSQAMVGLVRVALAEGDVAGAMAQVQSLLPHVAGGTLQGEDATTLLQIGWTCWRTLERAGDARAGDVLATVHAYLQARAATLADAALRTSFLAAVPEHREIAAAWSARLGLASAAR